ncbi:hypothetical protein WN55_03475 [Dufourea novaeangliae]|uniref:Uncharacterized protein n=1 Tax=Dufourea novaeangliae TaxID=178035 RepID=A0A154PJB7_DUFNO|nr:hypothetical protein WN55_03475 [Dufourea novaeangliae]
MHIPVHTQNKKKTDYHVHASTKVSYHNVRLRVSLICYTSFTSVCANNRERKKTKLKAPGIDPIKQHGREITPCKPRWIKINGNGETHFTGESPYKEKKRKENVGKCEIKDPI